MQCRLGPAKRFCAISLLAYVPNHSQHTKIKLMHLTSMVYVKASHMLSVEPSPELIFPSRNVFGSVVSKIKATLFNMLIFSGSAWDFCVGQVHALSRRCTALFWTAPGYKWPVCCQINWRIYQECTNGLRFVACDCFYTGWCYPYSPGGDSTNGDHMTFAHSAGIKDSRWLFLSNKPVM